MTRIARINTNWAEKIQPQRFLAVFSGTWSSKRGKALAGAGAYTFATAGLEGCRADLARIFHSHLGKSREKPYEKRGANTFECVVEKTRHAGLETCDTAGWEACATALECRLVSRRIVARFQRLMATVAANPGRCPGLSCCGLSGLLFAAPFWIKKAMDFPLTERLRGCATAGWEACATTLECR